MNHIYFMESSKNSANNSGSLVKSKQTKKPNVLITLFVVHSFVVAIRQ